MQTGDTSAVPAYPETPDSGQPPATRPVEPIVLRLAFTGTGSEYFRIWIVNTLLTIVTFGIYSAWAKVRTLQYFYRNTSLDGATFDYHGKPAAILKGRAIVFVLALAFQLAGKVSPMLAVVLALALAAVFPLLLVRSLRFRMANSSYRGLRFAFTGGDADAYKVFVLWPLLTVFTLGALAPLAHQRLKHYQHNHTRFGTAPFAFDASAGSFYGVYLRTFAMTIVVVLVAVVGGIALGAGAGSGRGAAVLAGLFGTIGIYVAVLAVGPYFNASLQNLVWNHTTLVPHGLRSEVNAGRLFYIFLTNMIGIALTLGLFLPFARVRSARYRVECMSLLARAPLDAFVAGQAESVGALGDAAADWYDIDIAL
ncbi:hypothetical protein LMG31506_00581 [Cupriavidus yeoncheonensis]|uniref:DUF898 domain-containing protein n=1 Tax=Cupriavidus yeoncheonensis TaxID=1462994 RepID=A0A916INM6_9BURK|nr:YjgN family protein [Cupriavidus yeoncheonensis]CAG2129061.1 hypothetical protein LMG31506_00581 [Cupriavidus yeoncheonensis]